MSPLFGLTKSIMGVVFSPQHILKHNFVLHESYIEQYSYGSDFQDVYASLSQGKKNWRVGLSCT